MTLMMVQVRAFPTNATVKAFEESGEQKKIGKLDAQRVFLSSFDLNDICAIEAFIGPDEIEALEQKHPKSRSVDDPKRLGNFLQILPSGTVVTYSFRAVDPGVTSLEAEELASFGARIFRAGDAEARIAKQFLDGAVKAGWAEHSKIMKYDSFRSRVAEDEFVEDMQWKGWHSTHFISTFDPLEESGSAEFPWNALSSGSARQSESQIVDGCQIKPIAHFYFGWRMPVRAGDPFEQQRAVKELLEPAGYMISRRSILAGGSINLRHFADRFVQDESDEISEEDLRRYIAVIRLNLLKIQDFSASSKKGLRSVFEWMSRCNDLDAVEQRFEQTERPITVTLKAIEEERSEREGRWLRFILLIFTSFTFLSVVADIIGLLDFDAQLLELSDRLMIFGGALIFTLVTILVGIFGGRRR